VTGDTTVRHPGATVSQTVKCVVWDLDDTLWDGVLLEGDEVALRPGAREILATLDDRGILNSIASRNDADSALAKLAELGVAEYCLCPQINWNAKSQSVAAIAQSLNIGIDSLAFIDDQRFERDEVAYEHPSVLCMDAHELTDLLVRPEFIPKAVTDESRQRRLMYRSEQQRKVAEEEFSGPQEAFLAGLDMELEIARAQEADLRRAEELTVRTNQLNTSGRTYSYEELDALRTSPDHLLLIARLNDCYGPYGTIGLVLVETRPERWRMKILLMSCRVMSRGVGTVLANHVKRLARGQDAPLFTEFVPTGRNRMMFVSLKFNGFREVGRDEDGTVSLQADLVNIPADPGYLKVLRT